MAKVEIPGWSAMAHGLEVGKHPESIVEQITTDKGQSFKMFRLFKPYVDNYQDSKTRGQWIKGYAWPLKPEVINALVDRINHLIGTFMQGEMNGSFVFQPGHNPHFKPPVQQQQFAPQQAPQQQYAPNPTGYAPPVSQPPVQYGQPPQGYPQQQMFQGPPQAAPQAYAPQSQPPQAAPQQQQGYPAQYPPGTYIPPQS